MTDAPGNDAWTLFERAQVARLASVTADGHPHVVPVVFALQSDPVRADPVRADTLYTAVDGKPKSTRRLRRLANIAAHPQVSLLVDHYDDDWSLLWWVRADGTAKVYDSGPVLDAGLAALREKYPQYRTVTLDGPVIAVTLTSWTAWPS